MINIILLIIATIICCFLFNKIQIKSQIQDLKKSYISTFDILKSKGKTEFIIAESLKQMRIILILFLKIILVVIPFLIFATYIFIYNKKKLNFFIEITPNLTIIIIAVLYFSIKKYVIK